MKTEEGKHIKWKMENGELVQVKVGDDIFEKVTDRKVCATCRESRPREEFSHCRNCHYDEALKNKQQYAERCREKEEQKECTECHKAQPITEFYLKKKTGKRYPKCKTCYAKKSKDAYVQRQTKKDQLKELKECTQCHETKPVTEFYILKKTGKPMADCKVCHKKKAHDAYANKHQKKTLGDDLTQSMERTLDATIVPTGQKTVVEKMTQKPDRGISDGTSPDALPLTDSGSVIEEKAEEKTQKKWSLFHH